MIASYNIIIYYRLLNESIAIRLWSLTNVRSTTLTNNCDLAAGI